MAITKTAEDLKNDYGFDEETKTIQIGRAHV